MIDEVLITFLTVETNFQTPKVKEERLFQSIVCRGSSSQLIFSCLQGKVAWQEKELMSKQGTWKAAKRLLSVSKVHLFWRVKPLLPKGRAFNPSMAPLIQRHILNSNSTQPNPAAFKTSHLRPHELLRGTSSYKP